MKNSLLLLFLITHFSAFSQFMDVSEQIGIDHLSYSRGFLGGGAVFFDYNNDGFLDLYVTGAEYPDKLYENFGDGTFFDVSVQSRILKYTEDYYTDAVVSGDIDNDGCEDLFITSFDKDRRNILLKNNCNGTFTNIGYAAGLKEETSSVGVAFIDYNNDGFLDIYVLNYIDKFQLIADENNIIIGIDRKCLPDYFYINNGDQTFTEVSEQYGLNNEGCGFAILPTDYDYDGDQDIYIANDHGEFVVPNTLYRNDYPLDQFTDYSAESGLGVEMFSMGIGVGDFDEDGYLDYYVSNLGNNKLLKNNGNFTFEDKAHELNLTNGFHNDTLAITSWGNFFFDNDNDTDLDLFIANGYIGGTEWYTPTVLQDTNRYYQNSGNGVFQDMTEQMGLINDEKNKGAIYGDYDMDGDLDIFVVNNSADTADRSSFYKNLNSNNNNWIQIKLEGTSPVNYNAFGTFIRAYRDGREFIREHSSGGSYASQHSQLIHFGLGSYNYLDSLIIKWPDQSVSKFYSIATNHFYHLKMGSETLEIMGCMDPNSQNYNPDATYNSGCLKVKLKGCTEPDAKNYDPIANFNDGSCDYTGDEVVTGLEDLEKSINVYPNPFGDYLNLRDLASDKDITVSLYDLMGNNILSRNINLSSPYRLLTSNLRPGIYFLVIEDHKGVVYTSKLIRK